LVGVVLLAAISWGPGRAAAIESEVPVGVRLLGMGYAGVAAPTNASATSINIGAASLLEDYALEMTTANLSGLLRANYVAGSAPLSDSQAIGFDWLGIGTADEELGFTQNRMRLGYSASPSQGVGLGFGLNYRTQRASLDGTALGSAAGWSADIGATWAIPRAPGLHAAVGIRNWMSLVGPGDLRPGAWIRVDDGSSQRVTPRSRAFGLSYARGPWNVAADVNDGWRLGAERLAGAMGALRLGAFIPTRDGEGATLTVGGALRWDWGSVDYAYVAPSQAAATSHVGVTLRTSYLDPPVTVEAIAVQNLYPALREFYARPEGSPEGRRYEVAAEFAGSTTERLGELWLHNPGDEAVRVSVRMRMGRYTERGGTEVVGAVRIGPDERRVVPLQNLLLADEALELVEGRPVEARLDIADVRNPARRRAVLHTTLFLHGRNELVLDDVAKLAAFVTPTDPTVSAFATRVLREAEKGEETGAEWGGMPEGLRRAVALFSGLGEMTYSRDPNLPRESGTIDAIKYPSELVGAIADASGDAPIGDCDDSTALVCSLFEAAGVSTALIQTPRHVLMAFDLGGLSYGSAQANGLGDVTIPIDGNAWAPLETTLLDRGFAEAWRAGLAEARGVVLGSATLRSAWERFGSASPSFPAAEISVAADELRERIALVRADEWFQSATAPFMGATQNR